MSDATINLSEKELKVLLKHVVLANWMLESNKIEKDDEGLENEALHQKLLALANENGTEEGIIFDKDAQIYFMTEEKEEDYHRYIDLYNEEVFWDVLEDALAGRDFIEKHGKKTVAEMDSKKRFILLEREVERYNREFVKHGLKNLRLVK
jgi:hypothetical protein